MVFGESQCSCSFHSSILSSAYFPQLHWGLLKLNPFRIPKGVIKMSAYTWFACTRMCVNVLVIYYHTNKCLFFRTLCFNEHPVFISKAFFRKEQLCCWLNSSDWMKRNVSATLFPEILFQTHLAVLASYPVQTAFRRLFNSL